MDYMDSIGHWELAIPFIPSCGSPNFPHVSLPWDRGDELRMSPASHCTTGSTPQNRQRALGPGALMFFLRSFRNLQVSSGLVNFPVFSVFTRTRSLVSCFGLTRCKVSGRWLPVHKTERRTSSRDSVEGIIENQKIQNDSNVQRISKVSNNIKNLQRF